MQYVNMGLPLAATGYVCVWGVFKALGKMPASFEDPVAGMLSLRRMSSSCMSVYLMKHLYHDSYLTKMSVPTPHWPLSPSLIFQLRKR